jgi:hypothetical protein
MELISSTTVNAAAAALAVNVQSTVDSVWILVLIALSIPLGFYIIHRVIGLFPGHRGR